MVSDPSKGRRQIFQETGNALAYLPSKRHRPVESTVDCGGGFPTVLPGIEERLNSTCRISECLHGFPISRSKSIARLQLPDGSGGRFHGEAHTISLARLHAEPRSDRVVAHRLQAEVESHIVPARPIVAYQYGD